MLYFPYIRPRIDSVFKILKMKKGILFGIFFLAVFSVTALAQDMNQDRELYMDFVLQRKVYTKPDVKPECKINFPAFITKKVYYDTENLSKKSGEVAFILEADGSIRQAWVVKSINKDIDKQVIFQIKQSAKQWKVGLVNGKPVPVQLTIPYTLDYI